MNRTEPPAVSDVVLRDLSRPGLVLVVDDNPTNVELLRAALTAFGFDVLAAEEGEGGLLLARSQLPDAILLDVHMPGLDGFQVCQQLKADASTAAIPVLFVTALNVDYNRTRGFQVGASDYITKPLQLDELRARVQAQVDGARLRRTVAQLTTVVAQLTAELEQQRAAKAALEDEVRPLRRAGK